MKVRTTWKENDDPVPGDIQKRAWADFAEIEREDWKPVNGEDTCVFVPGLMFPAGSMFCQGRRGTVFISSPDGKLTICPHSEHVHAHSEHH